jgi:hypothetical protein
MGTHGVCHGISGRETVAINPAIGQGSHHVAGMMIYLSPAFRKEFPVCGNETPG